MGTTEARRGAVARAREASGARVCAARATWNVWADMASVCYEGRRSIGGVGETHRDAGRQIASKLDGPRVAAVGVRGYALRVPPGAVAPLAV